MKNLMNLKKIFAAACLTAMVGCQGSATKPTETAGVRSDVTDIRPTEAATSAYQPTPIAYEPAPVQPVAFQTTTTTTTPIAASTIGGAHVVRHGETLFSIAKSSYGDGKQWTKIASANPGVSPTTLKVGQTLIVP